MFGALAWFLCPDGASVEIDQVQELLTRTTVDADAHLDGAHVEY